MKWSKCLTALAVLALLTAGCSNTGSKSSSEHDSAQSTILTEAESQMNNSYPPTSQAIETSEVLSHSSVESLDKLITTSYPQKELISYIHFLSSENVNTMLIHLNEEYPVECLRTFDDSLPYCIYKLQEGGLLYVFFHGTPLKFTDYVFVVKEPLTQDSFRKIKKGSTLAEVEAVDPGTKLIHSIKKEQPYGMDYLSFHKKSFHMVKGGFMSIHYTGNDLEDFRVESIEFVPDGAVLNRISEYYMGEDFYLGYSGDFAYSVLPQDYPD